MTFRLDRLTPTSKQTAEVAGRLTLRGVTRPIAFEARVIRFGPAADDPDRFEAGFDLAGAIDRTAFGSTGGLPEVARGAADPHPAADAFGLTMRLRDSADGWGAVTRLLHWGMAALILFQLGFGLWMTRVPDLLRASSSPRRTRASAPRSSRWRCCASAGGSPTAARRCRRRCRPGSAAPRASATPRSTA